MVVYRLNANQKAISLCSIIYEIGAIDLGSTGTEFTWCNNREEVDRIYKRLDRVINSPNCLGLYPMALVSPICPISLQITILLIFMEKRNHMLVDHSDFLKHGCETLPVNN